MLAIMVPEGPPTSSGARKSPRERTKAKVAPASRPGMRKRQDDAEECWRGDGAEVLRGFDERARDVFERRVDGKKNKRRVDVREHENYGERAVEKNADGFVRDVQILQEAIEDAVAAENGFPGVAANEIADPQRDDDELVEQFFARAGVEGEEIRERVAEQERKKGHGGGDAHGAQEDLDVKRIV